MTTTLTGCQAAKLFRSMYRCKSLEKMGGKIYQFDSGRNERAFYIVEKVMGMMYVYVIKCVRQQKDDSTWKWIIKWGGKIWLSGDTALSKSGCIMYKICMCGGRGLSSPFSYVYTCLQFRRCREIEWFSCCLVGGLRWLRCGRGVDSVLPSESVGVKPWDPTEQDKLYCYRWYRNRRDRLTILSTILLLRGFCSKNK